MSELTLKDKPDIDRGIPDFGILVTLLALMLGLSLTTLNFLSPANLLTVAENTSVTAIVAAGMTIIIITGGIDLSVGSVAALCGVVVALFMKRFELPVLVAIPLTLLFACALGFINGYSITKLRIPFVITTLATYTSLRGLAYIWSGGKNLPELPEAFGWLGVGMVWKIPVPVILMVIVYIVIALVLYKTRPGRTYYALGGNEEAVYMAGIPVTYYKTQAYVVCAFLAACGGILNTAQTDSGQPGALVGLELDAIAAVVIGGASISGGVGRIGSTLIGALIIGFINNGLNLLNVDTFWQLAIKGLIIYIAVLINRQKN